MSRWRVAGGAVAVLGALAGFGVVAGLVALLAFWSWPFWLLLAIVVAIALGVLAVAGRQVSARYGWLVSVLFWITGLAVASLSGRAFFLWLGGLINAD
jgi:ABC-type polysaccharide/polyol phosphate export permease